MNILTNIFQSDAFSLIGLTNTITQMPYVSDRFSTELNWEETTCYEDSFAIDTEQSKVYLLGLLGRGEALPVARRSTRGIVRFPIPRMGEQCGVTLAEVRARRSTGTMSETSIEELADQKMGQVKKRLSHSMDFARRWALDGIAIDPLTGLVAVDVISQLKKTQIEVKWDLTDATFNPVDALIDIKRQLEDRLAGNAIAISGWKLLAGRGVYRALKANAYLSEAWKEFDAIGAKISRWATADKNIPGGFEIADDVTVVDVGRSRMEVAGGMDGFIADNQFRLVPIADMYHTAFGPSDKIDFDGTILDQYVFPMLRQNHEGIDIEVDSFPLNWVDHPELIAKGACKLPPKMVNPASPAVVIP